MSTFRGDASEVYKLAADQGRIGAAVVPALRTVMATSGEVLAGRWADNVRATGGTHLPHLPNAITSELVFDIAGISVDVGPETSKKQGALGKGDEFGSRNQSPHLNGLRALDSVVAETEKAVDTAVGIQFR